MDQLYKKIEIKGDEKNLPTIRQFYLCFVNDDSEWRQWEFNPDDEEDIIYWMENVESYFLPQQLGVGLKSKISALLQREFKEDSTEMICDIIADEIYNLIFQSFTPDSKAVIMPTDQDVSQKLDTVEFETSRERETAYDLIQWFRSRVREVELKSEDVFKREDIERLQSDVHKITGDGDVMGLFNKLLGVNGK